MRMLWAMCASAIAVSALTGVLLGFYLDGQNNRKDTTPASTWVSGKPAKSISSTTPPSSVPKNQVLAPSTTTTVERTTTEAPAEPLATTEPPTVAPPPPAVTTTTTTATWPCSPLNPLPPPSCDS